MHPKASRAYAKILVLLMRVVHVLRKRLNQIADLDLVHHLVLLHLRIWLNSSKISIKH